MMKLKRNRLVAIALGMAIGLAGAANAGLEGLTDDVSVVFDQFRVPTIVAKNEHDAIFMQGYLQAQDRFFQMDYQRHLFSGRVSELVGPAGLPTDVQLRTLGLRRAAERSLAVQTPETMAWLEAYSEGVNAWLADDANPVPLEYSLLELDRNGIAPWEPVDCLTMVKGLAFGLSFDLEDIDRTLAVLNFRGVGDALGFNGLHLYNNDIYPTAPFDPTISIPSAQVPAPPVAQAELEALCRDAEDDEGPAAVCAALEAQKNPAPAGKDGRGDYLFNPGLKGLLEEYRSKIENLPLLKSALDFDYTAKGSNWWIAAGGLTDSGFPMLANDPHLALDTPATFHEIHLYVEGGINVTGSSFPGAPGIVLGCNDTICWGATVNGLDVVDVYSEVLLPLDPSMPTTPTHTLFDGVPEPLQFIPQQFLFNAQGDGFPNTLVDAMLPATSGGVTLVVPRRNNGPIVDVAFDPTSPTPLTGISVQYTGWSGTQELETFRRFARATSMQQFKDALQFFDVGSQNWSYADINGNIAYYTSAELPLREDLQFGFAPAGLRPPYWIRDGTHGEPHEWVPLLNPQPNQSVPFDILPFDEMPQIENPATGYILNANNDPIGTTLDNVSWNQFRAGFNGLLYLSPGYATGWRMGQLQKQFDAAVAAGPLGLGDYIAIQGNNQLLDAEVLTPFLLDAFDNASAPGAPPELAGLLADPRIGEAIGRLAAWDFSTPTGIIEGFDPGDNPFAPVPPSDAEVDASVAATIYSIWRGQIVQRVIDLTLASIPVPLDGFASGSAQSVTALRQFLDDYPTKGGTGASLINFFVVPGVADQFVARDIILLGTLQAGLDLLASDEFAPAFGNSTDLEDYRWGKLHRITFDHPLSPLLSIPPAGSPLNLSPELSGFSRAGGMGAIDASSHSARADGLNEFKFGSGPSRRVIATMTPDGPQVLEVLPGGESGVPGSPHQSDQLGLWLVNAYKPLPVSLEDVEMTAVETQMFAPPFCGDSEIDAGEECDEGPDNGFGTCDEFCMEVPLLVVLESFTAEISNGGVMVKWTTATEVETAGFRVLRSGGGREKALQVLTESAIPAQGSDLVGASYEFLDSKAPKGTLVYFLEDIDNFGRVTRHGPVIVERGQGARAVRAAKR